MSSTQPVILTLGSDDAASCNRREGFRPTTERETSGTVRRTSGRISLMKKRIPSSLGSQSIEPVNTREFGVSGSVLGLKKLMLAPVGITVILPGSRNLAKT